MQDQTDREESEQVDAHAVTTPHLDNLIDRDSDVSASQAECQETQPAHSQRL